MMPTYVFLLAYFGLVLSCVPFGVYFWMEIDRQKKEGEEKITNRQV